MIARMKRGIAQASGLTVVMAVAVRIAPSSQLMAPSPRLRFGH